MGIKVEQGVEYLAKLNKEGSDGMIWEFIEVERDCLAQSPLAERIATSTQESGV